MLDWGESGGQLIGFLEQNGLALLTIVVFLKAAGVPIPIPGDVLIVAFGAMCIRISLPLLVPLVSLSLATLAGALVLFIVVRRMGRGAVDRHGRRVGLTPGRLHHAETMIQDRGWWGIAVGRATPGLRLTTAVAAAVFNVHARTFASAAGAGAVAEVGICLLLGALIGVTVA